MNERTLSSQGARRRLIWFFTIFLFTVAPTTAKVMRSPPVTIMRKSNLNSRRLHDGMIHDDDDDSSKGKAGKGKGKAGKGKAGKDHMYPTAAPKENTEDVAPKSTASPMAVPHPKGSSPTAAPAASPPGSKPSKGTASPVGSPPGSEPSKDTASPVGSPPGSEPSKDTASPVRSPPGSEPSEDISLSGGTSTPTTAPTQRPTSTPTKSSRPSVSPSASPSGFPTSSANPTASFSPSAIPTVSSMPTPIKFVVSQSGTVTEYSCALPKPANYGGLEQQQYEASANICFVENASTDLDALPNELLSDGIIPRLAKEVLDCVFDSELEIVEIIHNSELAGDFSDRTDSGNGRACYTWDFSFQTNYFLMEQQGRALAVDQEITNEQLLERIYYALTKIFADILPYSTFTGFRNVNGAVPPGTAGNPPADSPSGADGFLQDSGPTDSSQTFGAVPILVIVCSFLLLVVVAVIAVKKRNHSDRALSVSHVLMKDNDDDDDLETDESLEKSSYSTGVILRDLDPAEANDADSVGLSQEPYPQVYVMDGNDADTSVDDDEELRFTSGAYWVKGQSEPPGPTFVTTDLKKAMKDLQPPPPTPKNQRDYVQDDTVDL